MAVPLHVAQFNVLADGLSGMDAKRGGFTEAPGGSLDWSYRRTLLVEELLRHGSEPDIVAMDEVDHYYDWFEPVMSWLGYDGRFLSKPDSPCKESLDPKLEDGCAIFWKRNKVVVKDVETMNFDRLSVEGVPTGKKSNQVALLLTLQPHNAAPVVVAATHLMAAKSLEGERGRAQQVTQLLDRLHQLDLPCIVAMDMNAAPRENPSAPYPSEAYPVMLDHALRLRSSYVDVLGCEPAYTTWKRRGSKEARHTIDYICVSRTVGVRRVLLPPPEENVHPERLPNFQYPSDHIALMVELLIPMQVEDA